MITNNYPELLTPATITPMNNGEWLETDGLGGFSMGSLDLVPSRRYHTAYTTALTPPVNRKALVHMPEVYAQTARGRFPLSTFCYEGGVVYPNGTEFLLSHSTIPWPTWKFLVDGVTIIFELFIPYKKECVVMKWNSPQPSGVKLIIRPFFSGRDFHSLFQCSGDEFPLATSYEQYGVTTKVKHSNLDIVSFTEGVFISAPQWNYNFKYRTEKERGYDSKESLPSPGYFNFSLDKEPAVIICGTKEAVAKLPSPHNPVRCADILEKRERDRRIDKKRTVAETFLVQRGAGQSIIAGYPWFSDWGRDTAIATRGLLIAQGFLPEAAEVLLTWGKSIKNGLLPNRFLEDTASTPEYNSVDASLWWIVAAYELLKHANAPKQITAEQRSKILKIIEQMVIHYTCGTDLGIKADTDGLLLSGKTGTQLTWMDAKIGDYVVTPRMGKPVEIQALWINALMIGQKLEVLKEKKWDSLITLAQKSFIEKFWIKGDEYLADVIDNNFKVGERDESLRPNQLFATGGLPFPILDTTLCKKVVDIVATKLLTRGGIRTLSPDQRGYVGHYIGDQGRRDLAYHQGTAWIWLVGAFVDSYLVAYGTTKEIKKKIKEETLEPLIQHSGVTLLSTSFHEIADGNSPFTLRGAPFQAWSAGEVIRAWHKLQ